METYVKNLKLFLAVAEDENIYNKIQKIKQHLNDGADVNAKDANNDNNTPLHIAVLRNETEIVSLLLNNDETNVYCVNANAETPLDIAQRLIATNGLEIFNMLKAHCEPKTLSTKVLKDMSSSATISDDSIVIESMSSCHDLEIKEANEYYFPKEKGTSGISGQLYESKLLCLVYLRARYNLVGLEYFYLGTNRSQIGALDDLYIKYKYKDDNKATILFLQAKHILDPKQGTITVDSLSSANSNYSLTKYFRSYLSIKYTFGKKCPIEDIVFKESIITADLLFVIYTCSKHDIKSSKRKPFSQTLMKKKDYVFILTGDCNDIFQILPEDYIDILTKVTLDERIKKLGKVLTKFIIPPNNTSNMMSDDLIKTYHVLLAAQVLEISRTVKCGDNGRYRNARFRSKFFSSSIEPLVKLRESMYEIIITKYNKKRKIKNKEVQMQLSNLIERPSIESISKLIGNVVMFNETNKRLVLIDKDIPKDLEHFREKLKKIRVSENVINEAIEIEGKKILRPIEFWVPESFGNIDLTLQESDVSRRISLLGSNVTKLLDNCQNSQYIVDINDSMVGPKNILTSGVVDIKGGIGGAVGNLFIMDEKSKLLKFNTNFKSLPKYAKMLLNNIQSNITKKEKITEYRFNIDLRNFPRISWSATESDKNDARLFLDKLYFCSGQAQENEIEIMLKLMIGELYRTGQHLESNNPKILDTFRVHSDALYLRFHDEIQKWWMLPSKAPYLTNTSKIFANVTQCIIVSPLIAVLNCMYLNEINKANIKFNEDVILQLEFNIFTDKTYIIASNTIILSAIKLKQYFKDYNVTFLDLDYVLKLPSNNYQMLLTELNESDIVVIIIVYENVNNSEQVHHVANYLNKKFVIITNLNAAHQLEQYDHTKYEIKTDHKNSLNDLDADSQYKILERIIVFQGHELQLDELIDDDSKHLIKEGLICKIIKNDGVIEIGRPLNPSKKIFDHYIDRILKRGHRSYPVKTLKDIDKNMIIITATAGMGKSTLLTHLLLETKSKYPATCAILIKLSNYSKDFFNWKNEKKNDLNFKLDITKIMQLIYKAGLSVERKYEDETQDNFEILEKNGKLSLYNYNNMSDCTLLELELFTDFFNKGKLTFLLDGFDEICPSYYTEVKQLLEILTSHPIKNCIWLTSRSYEKIVSDLEKTFVKSYTLTPFSPSEQKSYLEKYWKKHLIVSKMNKNEINCISKFIEYMTRFATSEGKKTFPFIKLRCVPLLNAYIAAIEYFKKEIDNIKIEIDKEELRQKWSLNTLHALVFDPTRGISSATDAGNELAGTPLHLFIIADHFGNQIKIKSLDPEQVEAKWNIVMDTYALYEYFIEKKIKEVCYAEKYNSNIFLPAVELKYQSELKEFKDLHAKLALFTFYEKDSLAEYLNLQVTEELNNILEGIDTGIEKRGFIDGIADGIPIFIHVVFAEYFAIEYICDRLKSTLLNEGKTNEMFLLLTFIMDLLIVESFTGLRNVIDYKLESDAILYQRMCSNKCRELVFNFLLAQFQYLRATHQDGDGQNVFINTSLTVCHDEGLHNIYNYFIKCVEGNINIKNVRLFLMFLRRISFLNTMVKIGNLEVVNYMLNCIRKVDVDLLNLVLSNGYLTGFVMDRSILHDNSSIISSIRTGLQMTLEAVAKHFVSCNVTDAQKDEFDIVCDSKHFDLEESDDIYSARIFTEIKVYFNRKKKT